MKKKFGNAFLYCLLISTAVVAAGHANSSERNEKNLKNIPFNTIDGSTYLSFIKNWDDKKQPVICGWIRSPSDWDKLFSPAMTMHAKAPTAPPLSFYDSKQILVVARVVSAPSDAERGKVFKANAVKVGNGVLRLVYQYREPKPGASYQIKDSLLVGIPKGAYISDTVQFIENDKPVCDVKV